MNTSLASRVILSRHVSTRTCAAGTQSAQQVSLPDGSVYFVLTPNLFNAKERLIDLTPSRTNFLRYPVILHGNGKPWYEANLWISYRLDNSTSDTADLATVVDDLVAYLRFLEGDHSGPLSWLDFSAKFKFKRPTYQFQEHLSNLVERSEASYNTSNRRLHTVISFYRWLIEHASFSPANPPWKEKEVRLLVNSRYGSPVSITKLQTDLKVRGEPHGDPYDTRIIDGGKLRPLNVNEQDWLKEALSDYDNYELQLMHWMAIHTGSRIQTVLTLRKKHFWKSIDKNSPGGSIKIHYRLELPKGYVIITVGPGTGVDTKGNKRHDVYCPLWLYEKLHTYVHSKKATKRRERAANGDTDEQYLFLTKNCQPWYASKQTKPDDKDVNPERRSHIRGGALRTLISQEIIPRIIEKQNCDFAYQFHDLRATFGINEINRLFDQPKNPADPKSERWTLTEVLFWIMARLNHSNISTTEGYVKYREMAHLTRMAQDHYEETLFG